MDQQPPATNQRQRGTWTLATGLASKDMVELFAFTTVDMGLATCGGNCTSNMLAILLGN